ncbi:MAG TPA: DUF1127 domain-containing protein [Ramlibacter sp.]|nr:DUF1127 domain-containing protein [Ramlibacter sp.]
MSYAIQTRPASRIGQRVAWRFIDGLRSALRGLLAEMAGAWRYGVARREFAQLDDSTLRDIGMSRSEFDSYWAETHGRAEPTRLRVTQRIGGKCRPPA